MEDKHKESEALFGIIFPADDHLRFRQSGQSSLMQGTLE